MNCSDPTIDTHVEPDELLQPSDGALVVATEFVAKQLLDIAEVLPNSVKVKWIAELAELFTNFSGKD